MFKMLKNLSRNSTTQMFLASRDQLKLISGSQRKTWKNRTMRNQSTISFNLSTFKKLNTGVTTKCNKCNQCNRTKEACNIKIWEIITEETNTTTEEAAEEEAEVETEEVAEVVTTRVRVVNKTITKIDKDNNTPTKEDHRVNNNNNNQDQECLKLKLKHLNQLHQINSNQCSSSQLLRRFQWFNCNQLTLHLSTIFQAKQRTNSSETVFMASSKPPLVTNLLQELLVCFWMTMPVLTSNNSWVTAHTLPARFMRLTHSFFQANSNEEWTSTPVESTEIFQAMHADCKEDLT